MTDELLRGWKEICAYLRVSRATAFRYKQVWGMPVVHLPNKTVAISKAMIHEWLLEAEKIQQEELTPPKIETK